MQFKEQACERVKRAGVRKSDKPAQRREERGERRIGAQARQWLRRLGSSLTATLALSLRGSGRRGADQNRPPSETPVARSGPNHGDSVGMRSPRSLSSSHAVDVFSFSIACDDTP